MVFFLAPLAQILIITLLIQVVKGTLRYIFVTLDCTELNFTLRMVPTPINCIFAVWSVAPEPQLAVQERVFFLTVYLLAIVTVKSFVEQISTIFTEEGLFLRFDGAINGPVGESAKFFECILTGYFARRGDCFSQHECLFEDV